MRTPFKFTADSETNAALVGANGYFWLGKGVGSTGKTKGEICFNTSMTGYQEILTDPSYAGQIITFTFPHVGNVGINTNDYESQQIHCNGFVLREEITAPSNFRATDHLEKWLTENDLTGISGVDTRDITETVRIKGAHSFVIQYAKPGEDICIETLIQEAKGHPTLLGQELASTVTTEKAYQYTPSEFDQQWLQEWGTPIECPQKYRVVVVDFGVKKNILNCLHHCGFEVTVVPATTTFEELISHSPQGIFLSNGPGDPFATFEDIQETLEQIIDHDIPVFGICLGNQLLSLASGLSTTKMHLGHRGGNHPVKNLETGRVEITSQNHGFCVAHDGVPANVKITHESLFDQTVEGICRTDKQIFAVQYHPESSPGPHDSQYLFNKFYEMIHNSQQQGLQ